MKKDISHFQNILKLMNILIKCGESFLYEIKFLNSFAFVSSSLARLADNFLSEDKFNQNILVKRKGIDVNNLYLVKILII